MTCTLALSLLLILPSPTTISPFLGVLEFRYPPLPLGDKTRLLVNNSCILQVLDVWEDLSCADVYLIKPQMFEL